MNKKYWYIGIIGYSNEKSTLTYVTSIDNSGRLAYWKRGEKPLAFSKQLAFDIAEGLAMNLYNCVVVCSFWELNENNNNIG